MTMKIKIMEFYANGGILTETISEKFLCIKYYLIFFNVVLLYMDNAYSLTKIMNCEKTYDVKVIECGTYAYIVGKGYSNKCFYLCLLYFIRYELGNRYITMSDLFNDIYNPDENNDNNGQFDFFDNNDFHKYPDNKTHDANETITQNKLNIFLKKNNIKLSIFTKNFVNSDIEKIDENKIKYKIYQNAPENYNVNGEYWLKLFNSGGHYQIIDSIKFKFNNDYFDVDNSFYNNLSDKNNVCFIIESVYIDVYLKEKILNLINSNNSNTYKYNKIDNYLDVENFNDRYNIKFFENIIIKKPYDLDTLKTLKTLMLKYTPIQHNKLNISLDADEIKNKIIDMINTFNETIIHVDERDKLLNFNSFKKEIHKLLQLLYSKENLIPFSSDENDIDIDNYLNSLSNYIKNHTIIKNPNDEDSTIIKNSIDDEIYALSLHNEYNDNILNQKQNIIDDEIYALKLQNEHYYDKLKTKILNDLETIIYYKENRYETKNLIQETINDLSILYPNNKYLNENSTINDIRYCIAEINKEKNNDNLQESQTPNNNYTPLKSNNEYLTPPHNSSDNKLTELYINLDKYYKTTGDEKKKIKIILQKFIDTNKDFLTQYESLHNDLKNNLYADAFIKLTEIYKPTIKEQLIYYLISYNRKKNTINLDELKNIYSNIRNLITTYPQIFNGVHYQHLLDINKTPDISSNQICSLLDPLFRHLNIQLGGSKRYTLKKL